jgi:excisionase family DNA binding protein
MNNRPPLAEFGVVRTSKGQELVFSPQEVAEQLDVSLDTIEAVIRSGELRASSVAKGKERKVWRVSETAIRDFLNERENTNSGPVPSFNRKRKKAEPGKQEAGGFVGRYLERKGK